MARAPQFIQRDPGCDRVEPGGKARAHLVALPRPIHAQEGLLHQLFGLRPTLHHSLQIPQQGPRPAVEERVEGRIIPRTQRQHELDVFVRLVRLVRRMEPRV